jgi:hypothetical protein
MAYAFPSAGALDYATCTYGASRLLFRGPKRDTDRTFVAVLGGSETYGRCVRHPFPDMLEKEIGLPVANFGQQNAGPDVFLNDPALLQICAQASVTVVQLLGAQNISNRFYTVHPRRNDRFLAAKPALRALYPKIDFTEFHFTRHLLHALQHMGPEAFRTVVAALQADWTAHMKTLLGQIGNRAILLWLSDTPPPQPSQHHNLFAAPALITTDMIAAVMRGQDRLVCAIASPEARAMGLEGMAFDAAELPIAASLPGPYVHREICETLAPHIEDFLGNGARRSCVG